MLFLHVNPFKNLERLECLGGSVVEHLPLAQGMILGAWDQVPHQAPRGEPVSLSAFLSVSLMNKKKKKKKKDSDNHTGKTM